jgi:hypothetical protein
VRGQAVSNVLSRTASGVLAIPAASTPGRHCAMLDAKAEWLGGTGLEACVTEPAVLQRKHSLLFLACTTAAGTLGEAGRFNAAAAGRPGAIHDSVCCSDAVRSASLESSAHRAAHHVAPAAPRGVGGAVGEPPTRLHAPGQRVNCKSPALSGVWSSFPPSPARSSTASRDTGETSWPGAGYKKHEVLRLTRAAPNVHTQTYLPSGGWQAA